MRGRLIAASRGLVGASLPALSAKDGTNRDGPRALPRASGLVNAIGLSIILWCALVGALIR